MADYSYFMYNGKSSTEFGIRIYNEMVLSVPERDMTTVEVMGRDGDLTIDNKRLKPFIKQIKFNIKIDKDRIDNGADGRAMLDTALRISDWLNVKGYHDFEWSMYPQFMYRATIVDPYNIEDTIRSRGRGIINVKFHPVMYYKDKTHERKIESDTNIFNKGNVEALPLIRLVPKAGQKDFDVYNNGKVWFSVRGITTETIIDSETMQVTNEQGSANDNLAIRKPLFPKLQIGDNLITFDENQVTGIYITPRLGRTAL